MQGEIFRHLRPLKVNPSRFELTPLKNGGVSFLFRPTDQKSYDYWVYMCPRTAEFSSKSAVRQLRKNADNQIVPWGHVKLDGSPILEQVCAELSKRDSDLFNTTVLISREINTFIADICKQNSLEEQTLERLKENARNQVR